MHTNLDELRVISNSLAKKRDKQYTAHILLLHTFPKDDDSEFALTSMGMKGAEVMELAQHILGGPDHEATLKRFPEIWLLSNVSHEGKRLFRIAPQK